LEHLVERSEWTTLQQEVDEILRWASFGLHLTRPWTVVLVGRPNVGKSSLINSLVGFERSIVFDQPGTTRDLLTAETVLDGWPIRLLDTAGLRGSDDELESAGITRARFALADADCRILLIDVNQPPHADDLRLISDWPDALIVANKSDLRDDWGTQLPSRAMRVSALRRTGLPELSAAIVGRLVPQVPSIEAVMPLTERQVRELNALRDDVLNDDRSGLKSTLQALAGQLADR
jgi:tRNA modification GTPase